MSDRSPSEYSQADALKRLAEAWRRDPPPDLRAFIQDDVLKDPAQLAELIEYDARRRIAALLDHDLEHYRSILPDDLLAPGTPGARALIRAYREAGRRTVALEALLGTEYRDDIEAESEPPISRTASLGQETRMEGSESGAQGGWDGRPRTGRTIGPYRLKLCLGSGGFGEVWLATRRNPDLNVAIKFLHREVSDARSVARFNAEAQALARLSHPNIASILDSGVTRSGCPYIIMEYVPGLPLAQYCDDRRLTVAQRLELVARIAEGMHYAHAQGLIHRDLKPDNILVFDVRRAVEALDVRDRRLIVATEGKMAVLPMPKIVDFGLAKAIEPDTRLSEASVSVDLGRFAGTPEYMAPEQAGIQAMEVDTRTDIFALGVVLYELMIGVPPLSGPSMRRQSVDEVVKTIRNEPRPSLWARWSTIDGQRALEVAARRGRMGPERFARILRGRVRHLVGKALRLEKEKRFSSLAAFAQDIRNYLEDRDFIEAASEPTHDRLMRHLRRHKLPYVAAALVVFSLLGGLSLALASYREAERQRLFAVENAREAELRAWHERRGLIQQQMQRAWQDWESDELGSAMLRLIEALRLTETSPLPEDPKLSAEVRQWTQTSAKNLRTAFAVLLERTPQARHLIFHEGNLEAVAFRPDGRTFATGGWNGQVRQFEADGGRLIEPVMPHGPIVHSVAYCPAGRRIVSTANDGTVGVWDARTGERVAPFLKHPGPVDEVRIRPDGTRLVTAGPDRFARVWDLTRPDAPALRLEHHGRITSAAFSEDGGSIATADVNGHVRIWDAESGALRLDSINHGRRVNSVRFSPEGARILTAGTDRTARLWDAATGELIAPPMWHEDEVIFASFSEDGRHVLTASDDQTARVWDGRTGQQVGRSMMHKARLTHAELSADGRRVLTTSLDNTARLWDAHTGKPITHPMIHGRMVKAGAFNERGDMAVTVGWDWTARVWTLPPIEQRPDSRADDAMSMAALCRAGQYLARIASDGSISLMDMRTGRVTAPADRVAALRLIFSPDGDRLAVVDRFHAVRIYRTEDWHLEHELAGHASAIAQVVFSEDGGHLLTASHDRTARIWNLATGRQLGEPLMHEHPVLGAAFSPDGLKAATTTAQSEMLIWSVPDGRNISSGSMHWPNEQIIHVRFSNDGRRIVSAGYDGTARVWDAQTGAEVVGPMVHGTLVYHADFSPDGQRLVTGSYDHTARLWDLNTGQTTTPPMMHGREFVPYVRFSPDGRFVLTQTSGHGARVWDSRTGDPITPVLEHDLAIHHPMFTPDGRKLLTVDRDQIRRTTTLVPDERDLQTLQNIAQFLAGTRLDHTGGAQARLERSEFREWWEKVRHEFR
ncbi:MAG: serine/threonine protein kinase [Phycisphaeraceae bacterium]|nr:serine/threonine protein kinase [Phycisphaeraceae bacterium]